MDKVQYVAETLVEKVKYVEANVDWNALWADVKHQEIVYLSIVFLVSKLVVRRIPENIRKSVLNPFLKVYNFGMVVFSFGCFLAMAKSLSEMTLYTNDCDMAFNHELFNLTARLFYYSKFVEYIDSWSLAMAGKPVSFLQSFHHFGAPWDMFLFYFCKNEAIWIFVLLNSFVHTIMYFYYLMALCKIPFPGKILITLMQITQFNVGFYLVWWYKDVECYANSPLRMFGWIFNYIYVGVVLLLFINFSIWTYAFPKKAAKPKVQ
eukprot:TRINITY_DN47176_c0_g1_i1.p1 TRINITY_DN47176_c0_g1~~TRINITY_DN47176_c0_g1_i1.p1  ORF type:complete len:263 (+),score=123.70 TRINITY_DN47176_c0_g1_i1:121-909(+)